jgi:hypothetical protein
MTCSICGSKQILEENALSCPSCNKIVLLPKKLAIEIAQRQMDWFDNGFKQVLGRFNKRRLIAWLMWEREKLATKFFTDVPSIELSKFISSTVLIKRVMEDYDLLGEDEANEKNTPELVDLFAGYITVVERKYLIEEDFGHYKAKESFSIDRLDKDSLMSNFKFYVNEDYLPILDSFEDNLVMNKKSAEVFLIKNKEEYEKNHKSKQTPVRRTPEETISILFPTLLIFQSALTKNKLFADTFNFEYLKSEQISPEFILKFIQKFPQQSGILTTTTPKQFKDIIRKEFRDLNKNKVYDSLVFSTQNKHVFPFFVNLDNNIFVSHNFIRLMGLFYYPHFFKSIFIEEVQKNSEDFEKRIVPQKLTEQGFKLKLNITDKKNASLQIDAIAWKKDILYVVETKVWDLKPFFEHRRIHNYRERDLKGVVDGKKYSQINGEERVENIPSLLEKIDFVRNNLKYLCDDAEAIKKIDGVVITKSHPTIIEYKGIRFVSYTKISGI